MLVTAADVGTPESENRKGSEGPGSASAAVALTAGIRAILVTASALVLTAGLGLIVWAVTPGSGSGPAPAVRAGVTAFSAANGMSVSIGRSALTLPPLMITVVAVALLATISGRGSRARGRRQESLAVVTASAAYAIAVTVTGVSLGGHGAVSASQWWRPGLLALLVIGCTTLLRGDGWRQYLLDQLPAWFGPSIRLGAVGASTLLGGGAAALAFGLVRSLSDSATVQNLSAPGAAGGFGMVLVGLAFLPNAVIAGAGFSSGVGFTVGDGTYSIFGSSPVELPPITLLTAAPDAHGLATPSLLFLLFPVMAAVLIGRGAVSRVESRRDRLFTVGGAVLLTAVSMSLAAAAAAGGVAGGEWSTSGVPPVLFGAVLAGGLGVVAAAVVGLTRAPAGAVTSGADGAQASDADEPGNAELEDEQEQAEAEPVAGEQAEAEPTAGQQAEADPAVGEQTEAEPAAGKSATAESATAESVTAESVTAESAKDGELVDVQAGVDPFRVEHHPEPKAEPGKKSGGSTVEQPELEPGMTASEKQPGMTASEKQQRTREEDLIAAADAASDAMVVGPPAPSHVRKVG